MIQEVKVISVLFESFPGLRAINNDSFRDFKIIKSQAIFCNGSDHKCVQNTEINILFSYLFIDEKCKYICLAHPALQIRKYSNPLYLRYGYVLNRVLCYYKARSHRYVNCGPIYCTKDVLHIYIFYSTGIMSHVSYNGMCISQYNVFSIHIEKTSVVTIISKNCMAYYQLHLFVIRLYRHAFLDLFVFTKASEKLLQFNNCWWRFIWSSIFLLYKSIAVNDWRSTFLSLFIFLGKIQAPITTKMKNSFIFRFISIFGFYIQWICLNSSNSEFVFYIYIFLEYFRIFINYMQVYSKQDLGNQDQFEAPDVRQSPCVTNLSVAYNTIKLYFIFLKWQHN